MTLRSSFRSRRMPSSATRMWGFLLPAVILQSFVGNVVGNKAGEIHVIHYEEGNISISFNGSHLIYYGSEEEYYYDNATYDYSPFETPATGNFNNSASHLVQGPFPFFFSLLQLVRLLLQDTGM